MAKIPESLNIGSTVNLTNEELLNIIQDLYRELAVALNKKPDIYKRETDGLVSDVALAEGDFNINTLTNKVEMLVEHTDPTTVVWTTLS